jgi:hypothetical protein
VFAVLFFLIGLAFIGMGLLMTTGAIPSFNAWSDVLAVIAGCVFWGMSYGLFVGTAVQS